LPDTEDGLEKLLELNTKMSAEWPNITSQKEPPADADDFKGVEGKFEKFFTEAPGGFGLCAMVNIRKGSDHF